MRALTRSQWHLLAGLWLLARGRRDGVPAGATAIGYDRAQRPMAILMILMSIAELVAFELLVPWAIVRLVLLVLSVLALVWVLAMVASTVVRPHVVTAEQLRLRLGAGTDISIPLARITSVTVRRATILTSTVAVQDGVLMIPIFNSTALHAQLDQPVEIRLGGQVHVVTAARFAADDPEAGRAALQQRLAV